MSDPRRKNCVAHVGLPTKAPSGAKIFQAELGNGDVLFHALLHVSLRLRKKSCRPLLCDTPARSARDLRDRMRAAPRRPRRAALRRKLELPPAERVFASQRKAPSPSCSSSSGPPPRTPIERSHSAETLAAACRCTSRPRRGGWRWCRRSWLVPEEEHKRRAEDARKWVALEERKRRAQAEEEQKRQLRREDDARRAREAEEQKPERMSERERKLRREEERRRLHSDRATVPHATVLPSGFRRAACRGHQKYDSG